MKIKLVTVDFEFSVRGKQLLGIAGLIAIAAVASAAVPKQFVAGETLTAADLNSNFADLDTRVTAVEGKIQLYRAENPVGQGFSYTSTTLIDYPGLSITFTPTSGTNTVVVNFRDLHSLITAGPATSTVHILLDGVDKDPEFYYGQYNDTLWHQATSVMT